MNLSVIEHNGQRVLTTSQLAESFGTENSIINRNFQRNSERYKPGKHYFALSGEELKQFKGSRQIDASLKFTSVLYLWTEKGAWLQAKSLNTDLAWDAYEMLIDEYYTIRTEAKVLSPKEQLMASMQLTLETAKEVEGIKDKVEQLEDKIDKQMTLDYGMQRRLQKAVGARVYSLTEDESEKRRLFSEIYREIKDRFGVASYKDVRRKDLQAAIAYVEAWIPRRAI